jgi:hypothetical protein
VRKHIAFKEEDIIKLISILYTDGDICRMKIDSELSGYIKGCSCCSKLFIYKKITSIFINYKNSFKIKYQSFYVPMQTKFDIEINYILIFKNRKKTK